MKPQRAQRNTEMVCIPMNLPTAELRGIIIKINNSVYLCVLRGFFELKHTYQILLHKNYLSSNSIHTS